MNKELQTFIKDNKEFINKNQWYLLFDSWMSFADYVYPIEEAYLSELIQIFETVGIDVNMHERKQVVIDCMCDIVNIVRKNRNEWGGDNVPFSYVVQELPSKLLFTDEELFNFVPEVAEELGMTTRNGGFIL